MDQPQNLQNPLLEMEREEKKEALKPASFLSLFQFADAKDKLYMLIGSITSMAGGCTTPFFLIYFSDISLIFVETNRDKAEQQGLDLAIKFFIIGGAGWFLNFLGLYCWTMSGSRQALKFKKIYYKTLLDQEVAWYDSNDVNKLATQVSGNMIAVENAIGEKISILLNVTVVSFFGLFYAYIKCWQLSLMLTAFLPLLLIAGGLMMKAMTMNAQKGKVSYEDAAGIAQQAFSGIKTIKGLVSEDFETNRFIDVLSKSQKKVLKYTFLAAASFGIMNLIFLSLYSFGFWYSKQLIIWFPLQYQPPTVISTFFCFLIGGASIGQISPILKNIAEGKVAASKLLALRIREKTLIETETGQKITEIQQITMKNIGFKYQKVDGLTEKDSKSNQADTNESIISEQNSETEGIKDNQTNSAVLDDVSLSFQRGKVTAIVGESGSGKSTIVQLLLRYYDPTEGAIYINGTDLKEINIKDYRTRVGFVGQQPVLFSMSVAQNLKLANPNLSNKEIEQTLKKANAWDFIQKTEMRMETYVGTSGTQLSGGQKQRIAIARAIAKNPNLLVLDEATSALDRKNEKEIQKTLNSLSSGSITTVVIAHRLSTIKNADNIIVMKKGRIVESGTHEQLFEKQGYYHELIKSQMQAESNEEELIEKQEFEEEQGKAHMKNDDQNKKDAEEKQYTKEQLDSVFKKLLKECKGSYSLIFVGALAAMINGAVFPIFNVALSNILALLAIAEQKSHEINQFCLLFLGLAVCGAFCTFLYQLSFGITGERLVFSLRKKIFKKLLRMPVAYYDSSENTPGGLSTKLSQDSYQIHNMITGVVAVICLNFSTVSLSLILAFYYSWLLTLIVLGISPLLVISGAINMAVLKKMSKKAEEHQKSIGTLISDTVSNIRTVKSFGNEKLFTQKFSSKIDSLYEISSDKALKSSILQGLSKSSPVLVEGLTFYIAAVLFANSLIEDPKAIYIAIFSMIFAAMGVGQNSQFMPDMGKAKHSGANIFEILESKDEFQEAQQKEDSSLKMSEGEIEFNEVVFRYPTRNSTVLDKFNLRIQKGEKIGFVGPSGSGKSTIVQLLMRFYPVESGQITINGHNIEKFNLYEYRKELGLVSQEPTLFLGTVKQNIVYNCEKVDQNKIDECLRISSSQGFIDQWEQKLDKEVGQKGIQVSGGQKQRIALTRSLVRDPKIYLLDEFTSALDADTERVVFENMKQILKGKTSISIAHRLCTIEDASRIIVMRDGKMIEEGGYNELMERKENFYRLAKGLN